LGKGRQLRWESFQILTKFLAGIKGGIQLFKELKIWELTFLPRLETLGVFPIGGRGLIPPKQIGINPERNWPKGLRGGSFPLIGSWEEGSTGQTIGLGKLGKKPSSTLPERDYPIANILHS